MELNKSDLWEALRMPSDKDCWNCKFDDDGCLTGETCYVSLNKSDPAHHNPNQFNDRPSLWKWNK